MKKNCRAVARSRGADSEVCAMLRRNRRVKNSALNTSLTTMPAKISMAIVP